jgi:hypothetical protein
MVGSVRLTPYPIIVGAVEPMRVTRQNLKAPTEDVAALEVGRRYTKFRNTHPITVLKVTEAAARCGSASLAVPAGSTNLPSAESTMGSWSNTPSSKGDQQQKADCQYEV